MLTSKFSPRYSLNESFASKKLSKIFHNNKEFFDKHINLHELKWDIIPDEIILPSYSDREMLKIINDERWENSIFKNPFIVVLDDNNKIIYRVIKKRSAGMEFSEIEKYIKEHPGECTMFYIKDITPYQVTPKPYGPYVDLKDITLETSEGKIRADEMFQLVLNKFKDFYELNSLFDTDFNIQKIYKYCIRETRNVNGYCYIKSNDSKYSDKIFLDFILTSYRDALIGGNSEEGFMELYEKVLETFKDRLKEVLSAWIVNHNTNPVFRSTIKLFTVDEVVHKVFIANLKQLSYGMKENREIIFDTSIIYSCVEPFIKFSCALRRILSKVSSRGIQTSEISKIKALMPELYDGLKETQKMNGYLETIKF